MRQLRGFSLVEVLVVMMILGLTITLSTLGFQRLANDRLAEQAGQLSAWLQSISDNAVLDGALYGIDFVPGGDRLGVSFFFNYRWLPMEGDEWRSPVLEESAVLYVLDGKAWHPVEPLSEGDEASPEVQFFPTGMSYPEQFQLRYDGRVADIQRDTDGLYSWAVK